MKEDLNDLSIFAAVVKAGSFTSAAKRLAMPKSRVSMRVSALESRLGVQLLERTTRSLALTEAGRLFYESCQRVIEEVKAGEQIVESLSDSPRGLLRVSAPFAFARSILAPLIPQFIERFPELTLSIDTNNNEVDLIRDNIDIALRVWRSADQKTNFEVIAEFTQRLVASLLYLDKFGMPKQPRDLERHRVLAAADLQGFANLWRETGRGSDIVTVKPHVAVGEPETRAEMIKNHVGIGWLPSFLCDKELADGTLIECLPEYSIPNAIMYAATPSVRAYDVKVRALIEFISEALLRDSSDAIRE